MKRSLNKIAGVEGGGGIVESVNDKYLPIPRRRSD